MDWSQLSFADGLRLVAERRLFNLIKRAEGSAVQEAQDARRQLGLLGADEGAVNQAVTGFNRGEQSQGQAASAINSAVPGRLEQLGNIPAALGTALSQGRPGDALAQADVLGLKNLTRPLPLLASLGLGGAAALGQAHVRKNQQLHELLHGTSEAAQKAMKKQLPGEVHKAWDTWRRSPYHAAPQTSVLEAVQQAQGVGGKAQAGLDALRAKARQAFVGPARVTQVSKAAPPRPALHVHRRSLQDARQYLPAAEHGFLGRYGLPLAAASLPLLAREWLMPGGYRSGRAPAKQLLQANRELHPQKSEE
jgi:hypothetical protein